MRIVGIVNGRTKKMRQVRKEIASLQTPVDLLVTKRAGDTVLLTKKAIEMNPDLLFIGGGDGTLNQVINECMRLNPERLPVFALLPVGSANDFIKNIANIRLKVCLDNLKNNNLRTVDLIRVSTSLKTTYSINMSNSGIGALVARSVASRRRWLPYGFNYLSATLFWLIKYKPVNLQVSVDFYTFKTKLLQASIGNGIFAGNGLGLCPGADVSDGKLTATIYGNFRVSDFIKHYAQLRKAKRVDDPRLVYSNPQSVRLQVLQGQLEIETDGEYFGSIKAGEAVNYSIVPGALRFAN